MHLVDKGLPFQRKIYNAVKFCIFLIFRGATFFKNPQQKWRHHEFSKKSSHCLCHSILRKNVPSAKVDTTQVSRNELKDEHTSGRCSRFCRFRRLVMKSGGLPPWCSYASNAARRRCLDFRFVKYIYQPFVKKNHSVLEMQIMQRYHKPITWSPQETTDMLLIFLCVVSCRMMDGNYPVFITMRRIFTWQLYPLVQHIIIIRR